MKVSEDTGGASIDKVSTNTWKVVRWLATSDVLTIIKVLSFLCFISFFCLFIYWAIYLDGLIVLQRSLLEGKTDLGNTALFFLVGLVAVPSAISLVSLFVLGSLSRTLRKREEFDTSEIGKRTNEIQVAARSSSATLETLREETAAIKDEAEKLLRAANSAHVSITTIENDMEVDPFNFTTQMVREAESEIFILSPSMRNQDRESPAKDSPHKLYMDSLIASIDFNLNGAEGKKLIYKRLIQLHDNLYEDIKMGRTVLSPVNMDVPLYHHAKEIASRGATGQDLLSAEIKAIPEVVNFPSTLLVDAKYLFFSLPSMSRPSESYKIDLVVEICEGSDKTRIGSEFQKILKTLWRSDDSFELKLSHFVGE